MWDFARIHGGLQSGRGHDAREIYLLQDQDDNNSTGKICVAKGTETPCITDSWRAIFLVGMDIPPGFPGGLFQQDFLSPLCFPGWTGAHNTHYLTVGSVTEEKSRLSGDQNEAKRLITSYFLNTGWVLRTELAG
jgi:hypothetical protein